MIRPTVSFSMIGYVTSTEIAASMRIHTLESLLYSLYFSLGRGVGRTVMEGDIMVEEDVVTEGEGDGDRIEVVVDVVTEGDTVVVGDAVTDGVESADATVKVHV